MCGARLRRQAPFHRFMVGPGKIPADRGYRGPGEPGTSWTLSTLAGDRLGTWKASRMSTPQQKAPRPQHQGEEPAPVRFNILSITAFVSSFLVGVTGVILGLVALNQIKNTSERGRGFAIAALVIGCVYMVILAYITIGLFSSEGRTT